MVLRGVFLYVFLGDGGFFCREHLSMNWRLYHGGWLDGMAIGRTTSRSVISR